MNIKAKAIKMSFISLPIVSVSRLNSAWQHTMPAQPGTTLHHQVRHTAVRRRRSHTLAFCRSTQTVRPPHVYLDVRYTGVLQLLLIGFVVLEHSSLNASWPSHLHQHLQTILENLSFQQLCWLTVFHSTPTWLCTLFSVTARAFVTVSV